MSLLHAIDRNGFNIDMSMLDISVQGITCSKMMYVECLLEKNDHTSLAYKQLQ